MAFEFYKGTYRHGGFDATITGQGRLTIHPATVQEFALADRKYAVMGFDKVSGAIAVFFVDSIDVVGSRKVGFNKKHLHLPIVLFLRHFRIPFGNGPQHYNVSKNNEGFIVLDRIEAEREKG